MAEQVRLEPIERIEGSDATVRLTLTGVRTGKRVKLELHEAARGHEAEKGTDQPIGTLAGRAVPAAAYGFTLELDGVVGDVPKPRKGDQQRVIAVVVPNSDDAGAKTLFFPLPTAEALERRNWFFYVKMIEPGACSSNQISLASNPHAADLGTEATYDWHAHHAIDFFVHGHAKDANEDHKAAFVELVQAIKDAKHFVFISDWSFQPYFRVARTGPAYLGTIGRLLLDRATGKDKVLVGVLSWTHTYLGISAQPDEHNDAADERLLALNGNASLPVNFLWRGMANTFTYSHHQKFVVLDAPADPANKDGNKRIIKAFFGGLDLTKGRHDWHDHIIDAEDPDKASVAEFRREIFVPARGSKDSRTYDDWYNSEFQTDSISDRTTVRQPWHDIHACIVGPSAWDVVKEWIGRWNCTTCSSKGDRAGETVPASEDAPEQFIPSEKTKLVNKLYGVTLHDRNIFIQQNEIPPTSNAANTKFRWNAQVLRSMTREGWQTDHLKGYEEHFRWRLPKHYERSIQDSYIKNIRLAEDYIFIETQYFISSGNRWTTTSLGVKNELAYEICEKILERKRQSKPFHCYIICPMWPEGTPVARHGVPQNQRFFEWQTMQYMVSRLGADWQKYLSFYFLAKNGPLRQDWYNSYVGIKHEHALDRHALVRMNNRYMVYVHSKLMIVDDKYMMLGSANLNERSLAGNRDTEICIHIWPKHQGLVAACKDQLAGFRKHLFKEHFDDDSGDPKAWGGEAQQIALDNYWKYRRGQVVNQVSNDQPKLKGQALMLPFKVVSEGGDELLRVNEDASLPEGSNELLPDAPKNTDEWRWWSSKMWRTSWSDLAE